MTFLCAEPALFVNRDRASSPKIFSSSIAKQSSRAKTAGGLYRTPFEQNWRELIPAWPAAARALPGAVWQRSRENALREAHIQFNSERCKSFILVDFDNGWDSAPALIDASVPPHCVVQNRVSGNSHGIWWLKKAALFYPNSREAPQARYEQIRRGLTCQLGGDPHYRGFLTHNPSHPHWRTFYPISREGYSFEDFDGCFTAEEMRAPREPVRDIGAGRNCSLFDDLSVYATGSHRKNGSGPAVLRYKHQGASRADFMAHLARVAAAYNANTASVRGPLSPGEVRGIVKSVAHFAWENFTLETFSVIQSCRARRRWAGHSKVEPWTAYGLAERTYYRRKKAGTLPTLELRRAA